MLGLKVGSPFCMHKLPKEIVRGRTILVQTQQDFVLFQLVSQTLYHLSGPGTRRRELKRYWTSYCSHIVWNLNICTIGPSKGFSVNLKSTLKGQCFGPATGQFVALKRGSNNNGQSRPFSALSDVSLTFRSFHSSPLFLGIPDLPGYL